MADPNSTDVSYFWKKALQRTIFYGINPEGYPAYKNGHFTGIIFADDGPQKSLEELKDSPELCTAEKAIVKDCYNVAKLLFDNKSYEDANPLYVEHLGLWKAVKKLSKMLGYNNIYQGGRCPVCTRRDLQIEYMFDKTGALE